VNGDWQTEYEKRKRRSMSWSVKSEPSSVNCEQAARENDTLRFFILHYELFTDS
jgi:hypothetical protein